MKPASLPSPGRWGERALVGSPSVRHRLVQGDAAKQRQGPESLELRLPAGLQHGTLLPSTGRGCGLCPAMPAGSSSIPAQTRSCQQLVEVTLGRTSSMPGALQPARDVVASQPFHHERTLAEGQGHAQVCPTADLAAWPRRRIPGRPQSRSTAPASPRPAEPAGPRSGSAPSALLRPVKGSALPA